MVILSHILMTIDCVSFRDSLHVKHDEKVLTWFILEFQDREFIKPKMDVNNENKEPVTDLGLALGDSNQSIQSRLNSDSGAGANAGSVQVLDTTFVATEPLSELVWSTDKGMSLK